MPRIVADIKRVAKENSKKTVNIYNPDTSDFSVKLHDGKEQVTHTISALEIQPFPFHVANHIKKHLVNHLANKRSVGLLTEALRREIEKEIEVDE